jgi:hypothetical protein
VIGRIARRLLRPLRYARALRAARSEDHAFPAVTGTLRRHLGSLPPSLFAAHASELRRLLPLYLEHRFNLLGSGWVKVAYGETYAGFGPHRYGPGSALPSDWRDAGHAFAAHRTRTRELLAMMTPGYVPLDWQVDFKSGWRWDAHALGLASPIGHRPGVDIKLPWELARLQHLPALATGYALGGQPGFAAPQTYADEFRDLVLDFIAFNPAGLGVNWTCAMDVAIRAANMALGWDLMRSAGAQFDPAFTAALASSLLAHGRFVRAHLEWHDGKRANHYLADVAGLAFIAAYLPESSETRGWLDFAAQELDNEIRYQFLTDGASFEGSTAYHGLSGEMAVFSAALLVGEGRPLSAEAQTRLAGALRFSRAVTKPDGDIVQIGDNDSGHFFKLTQLIEPLGLEEKHLDQRRFQRAAAALLGEGGASLEAVVIAELARGAVFSADVSAPVPAARTFLSSAARRCVRIIIPAKLKALKTAAFPEFGLYIWRGQNDFISVRCGQAAHDVHGGHAHNDQLSIELLIGGIGWTADPGSFIYTPDLAARDRYRSLAAHFAPKGSREPGDFSAGPFRLKDRAHARMHVFKADEFLGAHDGFGETVFRRLVLEADRIVIHDLYGGPDIGPATELQDHSLATPDDLLQLWGLTLPFSFGYGMAARAAIRSR